MNKLIWGIIFGLTFGVIDILVMLPLKFESRRQKTEALSSAFLERFMIGFLIPVTDLGINPAYAGLIIGAGLSIPTAIITKTYAPIIGTGVLGGLIIGILTNILV